MNRSRLAALLVIVAGLSLLTACQPKSGAAGGHRATVPRVIGSRLTDAERTLSRAGYNNVQAVDASGRGRMVLDPANWVVHTQSPGPGASAMTGGRITLKVLEPTDAAATTVTRGVVPRVTCTNLQDAQNALQAAGFTNLASIDGRGQGRHQLLDRDWLVIRQSAAPGSRPAAGTRIVLTAVKYGELTGSSGCRS
jgi:hypothetical protein